MQVLRHVFWLTYELLNHFVGSYLEEPEKENDAEPIHSALSFYRAIIFLYLSCSVSAFLMYAFAFKDSLAELHYLSGPLEAENANSISFVF